MHIVRAKSEWTRRHVILYSPGAFFYEEQSTYHHAAGWRLRAVGSGAGPGSGLLIQLSGAAKRPAKSGVRAKRAKHGKRSCQ